MSPQRSSLGPTCTLHACARPVRSWGDYCEQHQHGLSGAQRETLRSVSSDPEQIESLERWMLLPAFEGERPWAA